MVLSCIFLDVARWTGLEKTNHILKASAELLGGTAEFLRRCMCSLAAPSDLRVLAGPAK